MKFKVPKFVKYGLSVVLAVLLFWLVFKDISLNDFASRLSGVNYWWIIVSYALAIFSHVLRAYRWNLMLRPFGYELTTFRTFLAVMSGYLANLALPRLGEVTKCGVLKKNEGVSMSTAIGTVVVERLIDLVILVIIIVLDLLLEFDMIYEFFAESFNFKGLEENKLPLIIGAVLMVGIGVLGLFLLREFLKREYEHPALKKINEKLKELIAGFMSIRNVENFFAFIVSTVLIWVAYFFMSYVIFFAMPETSGLSLGAGLSILVAAGLGMSAPVQGGVGAYHAFVKGVLVIYGIEATTGLFFATLLHTSQVIMIMALGGLSMLISSFISAKKPTLVVQDS